MDDGLPDNEYREYFAPDYRLQLQSDPAVADQNTKEYTDSVVREVLTQLSRHAQLTLLFVESTDCAAEHAVCSLMQRRAGGRRR